MPQYLLGDLTHNWTLRVHSALNSVCDLVVYNITVLKIFLINLVFQIMANKFVCKCGKSYKDKKGLSKHKRFSYKCKNNLVDETSTKVSNLKSVVCVYKHYIPWQNCPPPSKMINSEAC